MLNAKFTILIWSLLSSYALATPLAFVSGPVTYSGTGCPSGSTSVVLSPDSTSVSALFGSPYVSNFPANSRRSVFRKCTVSVPIQVTAGYRLTLTRADYRGAATLARRSWGYFRAYNFIKDRHGFHYGGNFFRYILGGTDEVLDYSTNRSVRSTVCGGKMILNFYSEYYLLHYSKTEGSDLSLDTFDFSLLFPGEQIHLDRCR